MPRSIEQSLAKLRKKLRIAEEKYEFILYEIENLKQQIYRIETGVKDMRAPPFKED